MRKGKYIYGWKLYVNYGQGWEYELFEETLTEARQRKLEYNKNCPYPVLLKHGREIIPEEITKS